MFAYTISGTWGYLERDWRTTAGYFDVHDYIDMCRRHYDEVGIGADYVNSLFPLTQPVGVLLVDTAWRGSS